MKIAALILCFKNLNHYFMLNNNTFSNKGKLNISLIQFYLKITQETFRKANPSWAILCPKVGESRLL